MAIHKLPMALKNSLTVGFIALGIRVIYSVMKSSIAVRTIVIVAVYFEFCLSILPVANKVVTVHFQMRKCLIK